jgi:hypothetical protein
MFELKIYLYVIFFQKSKNKHVYANNKWHLNSKKYIESAFLELYYIQGPGWLNELGTGSWIT